MVFLGETLSKSFLFPKFLPTRYAKLSFTQINIKMQMTISGSYSPNTNGIVIKKQKGKIT